MSATDRRAAVAGEQLSAALQELKLTSQYALASLRSTATAVQAETRSRVQALEAAISSARAVKEREAVERNEFHRSRLCDGLLSLPAPATMSFTHPQWRTVSELAAAAPTPVLRIGDLIAGGADLTEALLPNPALRNVTLQSGESDRDLLIGMIEGLLVRALTAPPPGGIRVHVLDPHHNGTSLARFGVADTTRGGVFEPVAVTGPDIRNRLEYLARRVATVSQRFLQGSHRTLTAYNASTDVPEPHHLVIALDVPRYGNGELSQLATLARTGAACGVHVLAVVDTDAPRRAHDPDISPLLAADGVTVDGAGRARLAGVRRDHVVRLEDAPHSDVVHAAVAAAEAQAQAGNQRALQLTDLLADVPRWGPRPGATISAPIGRSGGLPYEFALDVKGNGGVHALVAGMTGMGKSTLLHAVICALAHKYSPEHLNLYLVDGKDGVEFRAYAPQRSEPTALPHARVIAVKSDIEMYLSVLEELDEERQRRSQVFADHEVADIVELAQDHPDVRMPRIVAVLDEFHVLLDDKIYGPRAAAMLTALAKQGRNAGIHLLLATQSLNNLGAWGPNKGLFDQIGLRIALKTKDTQSSAAVLGEGNEAAARLTRRGEALANSTGDPAQNVPVQVALVDKLARAQLKRELASLAPASEPPFVFDGSGLAALGSAGPLLAGLAGDLPRVVSGETRLWLGAPVEVSHTVAGTLSDHRGANLAIIGTGRRDERDLFGVLAGATLSAAAQHHGGRFVLLAPRVDHPHYAAVTALADALRSVASGGSVEVIDVPDAVTRLADLNAEVVQAQERVTARTFVVVFGAARILEPSVFATLVETGPDKGFHVFGAWASRAELASAVLPKGSMASSPKLLPSFELRVMAQLPADERSGLGVGTKATPEQDRMVLWRRDEPNRLTTFIPFDAPGTAGWDQVLAAVRSSGRRHTNTPAGDMSQGQEP
ncbi:FtsK/SpoIIIE domain-containing protein [Geodermatophilus sp. SYSU D01119]